MLASLLVLTLLGAPARPSSAAMRKAFERNRDALVEVQGPRRRGTGVMVGADGQVLTPTDFVGLEDASVSLEGVTLPAKVIWADASLKLAMVKLTEPRPCRAAAVRLSDKVTVGEWLIGITRDKSGKTSAQLGRLLRGPTQASPFLEMDLLLPPGSPVFDEKGQLLAVSVARARALPLAQVKRALAESSEASR